MTLGEKIKARREGLNLSQDDLSEETGIHQTTISDIENGNTEWPRSNSIAKLAYALGVTTDYLLHEEESNGGSN